MPVLSATTPTTSLRAKSFWPRRTLDSKISPFGPEEMDHPVARAFDMVAGFLSVHHTPESSGHLPAMQHPGSLQRGAKRVAHQMVVRRNRSGRKNQSRLSVNSVIAPALRKSRRGRRLSS